MLLEAFASLLQRSWRRVFAQQRTVERAVQHGLSLPLLLGVGQAQLRSPRSVPRHPALAVAWAIRRR